MKKILIAFGTRPEVIKLAPVIKILKEGFEVSVLHSGQHRDLVEPMLSLFEITPDFDLEIMQPAQDLFALTQALLPKLKGVLEVEKPDFVMVQGDTTTSYLAALASFYRKIPVLHVEAGLRSHNPYYPFPEEINRRQITHLAHFHFAPTELNKKNLLDEGINEKNISVTGNTVIDALNLIRDSEIYSKSTPEILSQIKSDDKLIVLTAHRRENHGQPMINILDAVKELLDSQKNLKVVFPVHPNPKVRSAVDQASLQSNRFLQCNPLDYLSFLKVLQRADLILSDSGGIQEEAAALGKPVLVLRNETERQELINAGIGKLVGTDVSKIIEEAETLLNSKKPINQSSVFGDGTAALKIKNALTNQL